MVEISDNYVDVSVLICCISPSEPLKWDSHIAQSIIGAVALEDQVSDLSKLVTPC